MVVAKKNVASKNQSSQSWDVIEFEKFLVTKKKISARVAKNHSSRCRRVERIFGIDLKKAIKNQDSYVELMTKIGHFSQTEYENSVSKYAAAGTLRSAVRYLAEFILGTNAVKNYPSNHGISRKI
jgi:hypothetical protein